MNVWFHFPRFNLPDGRQRESDVTMASRCLMEGFDRLGWRFNANREVGESAALAGHAPELREDECDLTIADLKGLSDLESYQDFAEMLAPSLERRRQDPRRFARTVFLDQSDRAGSNYFSDPSVLLFAVHGNRFLTLRGARRQPWTYGVRQWYIDRSESRETDFTRRQPLILRNFKPSNIQSVRALLDLTLLPKLAHAAPELAVDGTITDVGRFGAGHFDRLATYRFCLAYCGHFVQHLTPNPHLRNSPAARAIERVAAPAWIERWDSYRFWESLVMGCVTINLDAEKYGFDMPVRPVAGEHYLALDLDDPGALIAQLARPPEELGSIAEAGRAWVIEHYSPAAQARRVLAALTEQAAA